MDSNDSLNGNGGERHSSPVAMRRGGWLHKAGAVLWPSFVAAGIATGVFFANIDPETLRAATLPDWAISREAGYTIGFFMFWGVTSLSSVFTALLLDPASRRRDSK